jgi:hypothetical protein
MARRNAALGYASVVLIVTLYGCSSDGVPPTAPTPPAAPAPAPVPAPPPAPPPSTDGFLAGMVLTNGGGCIKDAVVEIVGGQNVGQKMTQTLPCSWWDWDDGFLFTGLVPAVQVTIRASASGYEPKETTFTPSLSRASTVTDLAVVQLDRSR